MPRKPKKGYFVRGEFVAEGSARDLELKAELKGSSEPSRTELKRESAGLQKLGEDLLTLRPELLSALRLPDKLHDALLETGRITDFEGRRRQLQYIGKLMRLLAPDQLERARIVLTAQHSGTAQEKMRLHQAEHWRERLIGDDAALGEWLSAHARTDAQQLRALIRQARKDAQPELPGAAPRHGRAYRDIFQLVREHLDPLPDADAEAEPELTLDADQRP